MATAPPRPTWALRSPTPVARPLLPQSCQPRSSHPSLPLNLPAVMYFIVDSVGRAAFVMTLDKANDQLDGNAGVIIDSPSLAGKNVTYLVLDDSAAIQTNHSQSSCEQVACRPLPHQKVPGTAETNRSLSPCGA